MSSSATAGGGSGDWSSKETAKNIRAQVGVVRFDREGNQYIIPANVLRAFADLAATHKSRTDIGHITLPINDWFTIPPHPLQRDTKAHWQDCVEDFNVIGKPHRLVAVTLRDDGVIAAVDANTRTFGWKNGLVPPSEIPMTVDVCVYFVKDEAESNVVYEQHDGAKHAKDGNDQLFSAYGKHNFTPTQGGLIYRGRNIVDAVKTVFALLAKHGVISKGVARRALTSPNLGKARKPPVDECVQQFKAALQALDSLQPTASKFSAPVVQAFLAGYTKYAIIKFGSDWKSDVARFLEFFAQYQKGLGSSKDGKEDALHNFATIANEKGGGQAQRKEKLPRLLGALERYIENGAGKMYAHDGIVNMDEYFASRTALSKGTGGRRKKKSP